MEENMKRKLFNGLKITVFFLALFALFLYLYHSPFSYFNNSYGLLKGPKEQIIVSNIVDILDYVYINSIHILYLFLGEKYDVIIGFHIFVRMINCLLLFLCFRKAEKMYPALIITGTYGVTPFLLHSLYKLDGIIIAEFFVLLLLFIVVSIGKAILLRNRQKKQSFKPVEMIGQVQENRWMGESVNSMEKKESSNFLEISDEEIRRNAMIAAGLLPPDNGKTTLLKPDAFVNSPAVSGTVLKGATVVSSAVTDSVVANASKIQETEKEQTEERPKPNLSHTQFIENPLPVPKRHVKKEMDYEYQVPEDKMYYDIEEPVKNYFDIE